MCPIMNPQQLVSLIFSFLLLLWIVIVPVYLILRMERIMKLLEKKDQN